MSELISLYFGGFAAGIIPALAFYVLVLSFRSVVEIAELTAN